MTTYPGENPETVEKEITDKIESSVATIGNFEEVESMSYGKFCDFNHHFCRWHKYGQCCHRDERKFK